MKENVNGDAHTSIRQSWMLCREMFGPRITSIPGCRSRQLRLTRNHISQCHHLAHSPDYRAVIKYICVGGQPLSFFNFRFVLPKIIRWGQNNRWLFWLVVTGHKNTFFGNSQKIFAFPNIFFLFLLLHKIFSKLFFFFSSEKKLPSPFILLIFLLQIFLCFFAHLSRPWSIALCC